MGVNYSIVWDIVKNKIPELHALIIEVIENEYKLLPKSFIKHWGLEVQSSFLPASAFQWWIRTKPSIPYCYCT